jgi:hypothetical protein
MTTFIAGPVLIPLESYFVVRTLDVCKYCFGIFADEVLNV